MSTKNRILATKHTALYRQRRKNGLQVVAKPWGWLSLTEVQKIAQTAYSAATHGLSDPNDWPSNVQALFVQELASAFEVLVAGRAQQLGIACAPAGAQHYAQCLREDLPSTWRPQYPLYRGIGGVAPDVAKRNGIEGVSP